MDVAPALPSAGTHVELCPALDEGVDADRGSAAEAFSNGGQDREQVGQHAGDICAAGEAHAGIASDLHCRSSCDDSVPPSRTGSSEGWEVDGEDNQEGETQAGEASVGKMVGAGIGEWVSDYLDVCFATPRWETRGIWSQVLRRSFAHLTSLPLAHGDSLLQFERLVEERDYVECMHHLAEFAGNLARKYGFHSDGHRAACTQVVVFCLVNAQKTTECVELVKPKSRSLSNEAFLLIQKAVEYTHEASAYPLWDKKKLQAWAADSMARYYCLRGKFASALPWCNLAMKVESETLTFAVWSQHAALVLGCLNRHEDALQALQSCLKVLQNLRATIVRGLSRHEAHDSDLKLEPDDTTRAQAATEAHVTWKVENVEDSSGTEQAHKGEEREERDGSKEAGDECEGQMQDILALTSVTLANMALQNLRIFRCHEALCVAQRAADMVHSVMPHKHPLLRSILRILKAVEGVVKINTRVRDSPAKKHISVQVKKENKSQRRLRDTQPQASSDTSEYHQSLIVPHKSASRSR